MDVLMGGGNGEVRKKRKRRTKEENEERENKKKKITLTPSSFLQMTVSMVNLWLDIGKMVFPLVLLTLVKREQVISL